MSVWLPLPGAGDSELGNVLCKSAELSFLRFGGKCSFFGFLSVRLSARPLCPVTPFCALFCFLLYLRSGAETGALAYYLPKAMVWVFNHRVVVYFALDREVLWASVAE